MYKCTLKVVDSAPFVFTLGRKLPLDVSTASKNSINLTDSGYSPLEERFNALSHFLGVVFAVIGLAYLIIQSQGALVLLASIIYGSSLIAMFLSSTIYHSATDPKTKKLFKLLDHCAIYLLIAGTYTPFVVLSIGGWIGWTALVVIWSIALFGVIFKCKAGSKYPKISITTYLAMGWLVIFMAYPFYISVPTDGLLLLLAGGLCFSFGVIFYMAKKVRFTHAIWHLFVLAGCIFHYFSVYFFVL